MTIPNFTKEHADQILANINVEAIRAKKFKIVVDMINASACVMDPYLFEKLEVELIPLNNIPNGKFAHRPEPIKENLSDIENQVKTSGADLGFAHDPDADRLVVINEKGEITSEEYTLALVVENILSKNPGKNIVINLSTSEMCVDIAKKYSSKCFRTKIGEGYVVEGILAYEAIIGGEGNGGVIYPLINTVRDSFTALALILEILAERGQTVSECINTLPKYYMKKDKQTVVGKNLNEMFSKLKSTFKDVKVDEQDGIRLDFDDNSWVHLRSSNTEPIIRLFGEAKTEERINDLFEKVKTILI
jgi:phosphomannomutase